MKPRLTVVALGVLLLAAALGASPQSGPAAKMTDQALAAAIRERIDAEAKQDRFSGAVLVARGEHVVFSGAAGFADRDARTPNTVDTRFRIGSMNKMFTAVAVLQLVQSGRIQLQAPIATYLPEYPNTDLARRVTVHHLLTHTGGTGNIFGPEFDAHRLELRELADYVKLYGSRGVEFQPGSRWEYSNYGFLLLGVIVQRVSGMNYYDYVQRHIYARAGMTGSGSEPESTPVRRRAKGYMREGSWWVSNADTLPWRGTSAGGGYTTVGDLHRFAVALLGHVLLDAPHTELLLRGKVSTGRGAQYAYGFFDTGTGADRFVGHSGGAPGMNGALRIYPASGSIIAALANLDSGAVETTQWIAQRMSR